MERTRISSDTAWEEEVGYSRAVRVGDRIEVSGTTATDESGAVVGKGDPYEQTVQAIQNIEVALEAADAGLGDVIRTRLFVTDIDSYDAVADAHGECFGEIRPATSMYEVSALVDEELLVEIEAVAVA